MQSTKTWISRKAHLKSEKEPPFADSYFRSRENPGKSAASYPKVNPKPLCGEKGYTGEEGYTDDGLKTQGATKNTKNTKNNVAVRVQSDHVNAVVGGVNEPTAEVHHNNEITHLNSPKKRASTWIRNKLHTQSKPEAKLLESKASDAGATLTDLAFVDSVLYINDVHNGPRLSCYLHRCQRCHQEGVKFDYIEPGRLPFLDKKFKSPRRFATKKAACNVCNTSYSLKYAKLNKDAIDALGLQRAKKGQYAARGDGDWPRLHQATSHRPPASEMHAARSSHWLAEITRWEKAAPPFGRNLSQPLSNSSIREPLSNPSAKFNNILWIKDVDWYDEGSTKGYQVCCKRCNVVPENRMVRFHFQDVRTLPIRKDWAPMTSRTEMGECGACGQEYVLRYEVLDDEMMATIKELRELNGGSCAGNHAQAATTGAVVAGNTGQDQTNPKTIVNETLGILSSTAASQTPSENAVNDVGALKSDAPAEHTTATPLPALPPVLNPAEKNPWPNVQFNNYDYDHVLYLNEVFWSQVEDLTHADNLGLKLPFWAHRCTSCDPDDALPPKLLFPCRLICNNEPKVSGGAPWETVECPDCSQRYMLRYEEKDERTLNEVSSPRALLKQNPGDKNNYVHKPVTTFSSTKVTSNNTFNTTERDQIKIQPKVNFGRAALLKVRSKQEGLLAKHRELRIITQPFIDTVLYLNDVHTEQLVEDGTRPVYIHVCQLCDQPGVIFPYRAPILPTGHQSEEDIAKIELEPGVTLSYKDPMSHPLPHTERMNGNVEIVSRSCMSCLTVYDLRYQSLDKAMVDQLLDERLRRRFIAARGDARSSSPHASTSGLHFPPHTYDFPTLLPSILQWGADNRWWKYNPPKLAELGTKPLHGCTYPLIDDPHLYLNDVRRVLKDNTFPGPGKPQRYVPVYDYLCFCQNERLRFPYHDPKNGPIRRDKGKPVALRAETAACECCRRIYTLHYELLDGQMVEKLREARIIGIRGALYNETTAAPVKCTTSPSTYYPSSNCIFINDVYIVDIAGQPDANAENPRFAFACSHHAKEKWAREHQVFFEWRKHEKRRRAEGQGLSQRGKCGDCGTFWMLWYVELPREEWARVKASRR